MFKLLLIISVLFINTAFANKVDIVNSLSPFFGEIKKKDVSKTKFDGVYEVILHNPIKSLLISADGKYLIQGDIINLQTGTPLKASSHINGIKQALIGTINDKDKIIFKAKNEKYSVHVFTDVDCPYCKKLHAQMSKMNALGITIKYLAMPLKSLHPTAQGKMEKIWCAGDRVKAMNDYKTKNIIPNSKDCKNPVAKQLLIAKQLGIQGTPAIFLADGTHIPGYLPAKKLLKEIQKKLGK